MTKTKEPKFKIGDWVRFISGPDKGRSTTVTGVFPNCNGFYYEGYYEGFYCGQIIGGNESDTEFIGETERTPATDRERELVDTVAVPNAGKLVDRITNYLARGGLWNPESMEHDKVRALLIDCRDELAADDRARDSLREGILDCVAGLEALSPLLEESPFSEAIYDVSKYVHADFCAFIKDCNMGCTCLSLQPVLRAE
jgi:hypothetical protein